MNHRKNGSNVGIIIRCREIVQYRMSPVRIRGTIHSIDSTKKK